MVSVVGVDFRANQSTWHRRIQQIRLIYVLTLQLSFKAKFRGYWYGAESSEGVNFKCFGKS